MTLSTAAGSTASGRTQKKHLETPHAKEQAGENLQQTPLTCWGDFAGLQDELEGGKKGFTRSQSLGNKPQLQVLFSSGGPGEESDV